MFTTTELVTIFNVIEDEIRSLSLRMTTRAINKLLN